MAFLSVRTYRSISFPEPSFPWPVVRREALVKSKKGQIRLAAEKRAVIRWEPELSCSAFGLFQSLPRPFRWTRVTKVLGTILTYRCGTEQVSDRFGLVIISNTQAELLGCIAKVERSVTTNTFREIPPLTVSSFFMSWTFGVYTCKFPKTLKRWVFTIKEQGTYHISLPRKSFTEPYTNSKSFHNDCVE